MWDGLFPIHQRLSHQPSAGLLPVRKRHHVSKLLESPHHLWPGNAFTEAFNEPFTFSVHVQTIAPSAIPGSLSSGLIISPTLLTTKSHLHKNLWNIATCPFITLTLFKACFAYLNFKRKACKVKKNTEKIYISLNYFHLLFFSSI